MLICSILVRIATYKYHCLALLKSIIEATAAPFSISLMCDFSFSFPSDPPRNGVVHYRPTTQFVNLYAAVCFTLSLISLFPCHPTIEHTH